MKKWKKKFAVTILDSKYDTFVIYIAALNISFNIGNKVYPWSKLEIAHQKTNEIYIKIPNKYAYFIDIILSKLAI